jgi:hypothetical protein
MTTHTAASANPRYECGNLAFLFSLAQEAPNRKPQYRRIATVKERERNPTAN